MESSKYFIIVSISYLSAQLHLHIQKGGGEGDPDHPPPSELRTIQTLLHSLLEKILL